MNFDTITDTEYFYPIELDNCSDNTDVNHEDSDNYSRFYLSGILDYSIKI